MQPQATPQKNSFKTPFVLGVLAGAFAVGLLFSFAAKAFNGPGSNSAGSGNGSIGVDSVNDISIGTGTPIFGSKTLIVGSTTDSSGYALQVLNSNGASGPILYIRNDGSISVATTTVTAGTFTIQGALSVSGVLTAGSLSMQVSAGNITSGLFNGSQSSSSGNFAFPAYLGVGTSTQVSLPSPLSVYGDGYFSGALSADNVKTDTGQSSTFVGPGVSQYTAATLSASDTTALGASALKAITTGWANTGIGAWALARDTSGYSNVAVGYNASLSQTGGIQNAAVGDHVLFANQNGSFNVAIGFDTLSAGRFSNGNTAVGYESGFSASSTTGNVFIGFQSGYSDLIGSNNVFLGFEAGYFETSSNKLYIANASTGDPLVYGDFNTDQLAINTTTLNGTLSIGGTLNVAGNATTTGLTVTNLGSSGSPCLTVGTTGVVATTTCSAGGLSGGQSNFIPVWTGASSLGTSTLQANGTTTYTLNGFAIGTATIQTAGNLTITRTVSIGSGLAVSGLGSTGNPCINVSSIGVFATTTCDSLTGTGQANFIPLWTGAGTFGTSTLQANGTTTYTLNGFAIGTSTFQNAGNLFITGNYLGGTISAALVSSNAFPSGNFAFPSNLNVGTSSTATGPGTLSVYGSSWTSGNLSTAGTLAATSSANLATSTSYNGFGSVDSVFYSMTASTTVTNTVTQTSVLNAGVGTTTIPANVLNAGAVVRFKLYGTWAITTGTLQVFLIASGTTLANVTFTPTAHAGFFGWTVDGSAVVNVAGSSGSMTGAGLFFGNNTVGAPQGIQLPANQISINTTNPLTFDVQVKMGTATSTNSFITHIAHLEVLY